LVGKQLVTANYRKRRRKGTSHVTWENHSKRAHMDLVVLDGLPGGEVEGATTAQWTTAGEGRRKDYAAVTEVNRLNGNGRTDKGLVHQPMVEKGRGEVPKEGMKKKKGEPGGPLNCKVSSTHHSRTSETYLERQTSRISPEKKESTLATHVERRENPTAEKETERLGDTEAAVATIPPLGEWFNQL